MHLIKITSLGPYWKNGRLAMDYSIVQCQHCPDPECLAVCPEEAIFKLPDGLVQIREDLCTGCKVCLSICPYQAMTFDEEHGKAIKCSACVHLLDEERGRPACVKHCPTQALELLVPEGGCS
jgi:Fe-S-cluster-containing dehydrogenase component